MLLHASRIGLLDMSWNVLCPGCGGVLDATATLKSVQQEEYHCALCAAGYEPTLDEMVEVVFTVSPRVRRIAAHDPHSLPMWEYYRQILWSTGIDLPEDGFEDLIEKITIDSVELPAGERAVLSLQLPSEFIIIFEPVTHSALFLDVKGEPTGERRDISMVFNKVALADRHPGRCSPDRCGSRSTTGAIRACCLRCGSPPTGCTTCLAAASRS